MPASVPPLYLVLSATEPTDAATLAAALANPKLGGLLMHVGSAAIAAGDFTAPDAWLAASGDVPVHLAITPLPVPENPPFPTVSLAGTLFPVPGQAFLAWYQAQVAAFLAHMTQTGQIGRLEGFRICFSSTYAGDAEWGVLGASLTDHAQRFDAEWLAVGYTPAMITAAMQSAVAGLSGLVKADQSLSLAMFDSGRNLPRITDAGAIVHKNAGMALADTLFDAAVGICPQIYAVDTVFDTGPVRPFAEAAAERGAGLILQLITEPTPDAARVATQLAAAAAAAPARIEVHVNEMAMA
jgi:hypothetical protein